MIGLLVTAELLLTIVLTLEVIARREHRKTIKGLNEEVRNALQIILLCSNFCDFSVTNAYKDAIQEAAERIKGKVEEISGGKSSERLRKSSKEGNTQPASRDNEKQKEDSAASASS